MVEWIKKIGQGCLLLVMLLALIGVNVKQLYCCHAQNLHWELCLLPDEVEKPCEEGCCGTETCHHTTRYDFYKITDCSEVETEPQFSLFPIELPSESRTDLWLEESVVVECEFIENIWIDRVFQRPLLCTYLC